MQKAAVPDPDQANGGAPLHDQQQRGEPDAAGAPVADEEILGAAV